LLKNTLPTINLLDDSPHPIEKAAPNFQRWLVAVFGFCLVITVTFFGIYWLETSDPYIQSVLVNTGDIQRGHGIFQINCAGCHGWQAEGNVGPSLYNVSRRKSTAQLIHQVVSGSTPPMPKFQPSPQEMADLLKYLEKL
jgi:mono/diheme cytochrome c family protein